MTLCLSLISLSLQVAIRNLKFTLSRLGGVLAQLVERLNGIEEVRGSNPLGSTFIARWSGRLLFCPRHKALHRIDLNSVFLHRGHLPAASNGTVFVKCFTY